MHMLHTREHHAFPMPTLLLLRSVGIDISDRSVKYAELRSSRSWLTLGRYGSISIPEGVIASGKVIDPKRFGEILRALRVKENLSFVRVSLPEEQVYLFRVRVGRVEYRDLRNAVELTLEEHIPISPAEAVFDFDIVETHDDGYDLQVVAASKELLDGYLEALSLAGLTPLSFELEAQALARAVVSEGDGATVMVVDFGATRTGISIMHAGTVLFTSTVDVGGLGVSQAIQRALGVDFEKAEALKHEIGLSESADNREAFSAMVSTLSAIRDEISRTYTYWHTQKDDEGAVRPKIESIVLAGGNANLPGLAGYFSSALRMPVGLANPWVNITDFTEYIPEINRKESLSYATAIGLAMGDFDYE